MVRAKKIACVLMLVVFASIFVVGCGGKKNATPDYPTQNINGIIAWAAGGACDNVSRSIAPLAEKYLGKTIIMANKPGATGAIATQYVKESKPDGYTLLFHAENAPLYKVLGLADFDFDDFKPIMVFAKGVGVLVVPGNSPYNSYEDFINDCKARPGKVNIGATGAGGLPFNTMSLVKKVEKVEYNLVNYDGDGTLQPALIGNQIDASVVGLAAATQYVKTGQMKALGVFANEPHPDLPGIPALGDKSPDYKAALEFWGPFYGVYAPKETPDAIVDKLIDAFSKGFKEEKFQTFCKDFGIVPLGLTGDDAVKFIKTWQSQTCWALHDAGATKESPEKFGIPKP